MLASNEIETNFSLPLLQDEIRQQRRDKFSEAMIVKPKSKVRTVLTSLADLGMPVWEPTCNGVKECASGLGDPGYNFQAVSSVSFPVNSGVRGNGEVTFPIHDASKVSQFHVS
jgi:hypothetical protein